MGARIDVDVAQVRAANAMASQALPTIPNVATPAAGAVAPGIFAGVAPAAAARSAAIAQAEAGVLAHLAKLDQRSEEAATAYEGTNEDNRRSLTIIPGV
ncbi:hypothetical protein [Mycobacteroides abscessus]|uniref:hypothetical protein n=1 Tax=Mycobacteroides abscessus TaxID=36809 RepID=UPI0011C4667D|nr:hypothetical protein [Mycobacteroides abscessus]MBN7374154.1 hypothetical protein [Mycobacteroides abscessus subsp. abscessus]